jgi:anthranilate synthase component I
MRTPKISEGGVYSLVQQLPGNLPSPTVLFRKLTDNGNKPHTALLESAEPNSRNTQRSILAVSAALSVICKSTQITITALNDNGRSLLPFLQKAFAEFYVQQSGDSLALRAPLPSDEHRAWNDEERLQSPSSLSILRSLLESSKQPLDELSELQSIYSIFLYGIFAYDLVDSFESLPSTQPANFPDYIFYLADRLIVMDHIAKQASVISNVFGGEFVDVAHSEAQKANDSISRIATESHDKSANTQFSVRVGAGSLSKSVATDKSDSEFEDAVRVLKSHIIAGDVFQIVLSRTFSLQCENSRSFQCYESLRSLNPSPYLFYVNAGDFILFGASPESAVKVDGSARTVEISPIAGTRPRGLNPDGSVNRDLDSRLEAELRLDTKENAEHIMLVDLARNDVARVSKTGTRFVAELLRVEKYSHVMHLVSRVQGQLRDGLDALHAYQATMNMGTLTGAPKIRAMQLLRKYEATRRGSYGGALGYLRGDGSMDTAIIIRSAFVKDNVAYVRAGAGIVHDSVPHLEAEETRRKAEAVLRAIAQGISSEEAK